jgi:hypothetical protein
MDMKHTSGWFAVLTSVAMTACMAGPPDSEQGDESATTEVTAQATTTYNRLFNRQYGQCADAPGGAFNVLLKLATCSGEEVRWSSVPVGPANTYYFVNQQSGLCMEVNNGTATPGERIDAYTCNGSASEQWVRTDIVIGGVSYAQFKHAGTNLCLDTVGSANSNLMQWTCDPIGSNDAQLWRVY